MKYYSLAADLLYSFNAIVFVWMSLLWLREGRKRSEGWGGRLYGAVLICSAVLYLDKLARDLGFAILHHPVTAARSVDMALSSILPVLFAHLFYRNEAAFVAGRNWWRGGLAMLYALAGTLVILACADPLAAKRASLRMVVTGAAALASAGLITFSRRDRSNSLERNLRLWLISICLAWAGLAAWTLATRSIAVELLLDLIPPCFLFVVTYYVEKFTFFDVLMKRGAFAFASFLVLTLYFVFATPWVRRVAMALSRTSFSAMIWSASLLPFVLLAPWAFRRLSEWLDRMWLGRRFPAAEAGKYFLMGLQGAIGVDELVQRATSRLQAIFRSEAQVRFDNAVPPPAEPADGETLRAPIRLREDVIGTVIVRRGGHGARFLSEDVALLASLTEAFSSLLENVRLRETKLAQEKREQELLLNANRAELRALRAQVNPHFLFNALNTIAGLIRIDPDRAERTIEQLAEVFRYTLRRSDREWVRVEDELEAVSAYLDIAQTRFRERLTVRILCAEVRNRRIPAMMLQTLVENALKHGVGAISGPGIVEVEITASGSGLRLEVRDNGPGFPDANSRVSRSPQGGYGLRNIRERLRLHFGDAARLTTGRDVERGMTVVRVELPPHAAAPGSEAAIHGAAEGAVR